VTTRQSGPMVGAIRGVPLVVFGPTPPMGTVYRSEHGLAHQRVRGARDPSAACTNPKRTEPEAFLTMMAGQTEPGQGNPHLWISLWTHPGGNGRRPT
jgi:hypothetical protein